MILGVFGYKGLFITVFQARVITYITVTVLYNSYGFITMYIYLHLVYRRARAGASRERFHFYTTFIFTLGFIYTLNEKCKIQGGKIPGGGKPPGKIRFGNHALTDCLPIK